MDHSVTNSPAMLEKSRFAGLPRGLMWQSGLLALALAYLYREVLTRLASQWWNDPNFSHGFFVPAFSAYILWENRKKLQQIPVQPAGSGLAWIVAGLATLVVGVLGAELFLSRSSLILILGGMAVYFLGWAHFRAMFFAWAFLFLMIPIPAILFNQIAFPLQLLASQVATSLLSLFGVPVLREGNVLHLPAMDMEVVEACSGIRSLVSLGTLSIIYGYFLEKRFWPRFLLAMAAIPIAVGANSLRIVGTGLLGQWWDPDKALGFFHTFSGWVIFVISLGMLFAVHGLMRLFILSLRKKERVRAAPAGGGEIS